MNYHAFIKIYIGKQEFVTTIYGEKIAKRYLNAKNGRCNFWADYKAILGKLH